MRNVKKLFWLLLSAVILILSACQQTPEQPIVVGKNLNAIIDKAVTTEEGQAGSVSERINAPESYNASVNGVNGKLSVNVNASVTVPDTEGISVVRVARHSFTQQEADRMMEVLMRGETLYQTDTALTKEEIQEKLVAYYGMRDGSIPVNLDGENPGDTEKLAELIKYYEGLLQNAPETRVPVPADTKFHTPDDAFNPNAQVIEGTAAVNGKAAYLYINDGFFGDNNIEATFVNAKTQLEGNYNSSPYTVLSDEDAADIQVPAGFTMTEDDARRAAEDILARLGITGMACVKIQYAVMSDEFATGDVVLDADATVPPQQWADGKWAYSLQFQREINGIPVTLTRHSGNSLREEDDYSQPWPYERLELIADETGVVYFNYVSPYDVKETVTENAALLEFPKIASVFENMLPVAYGYLNEEGTAAGLRIEVSEARLGLMRVTEQNSRDSGLLIPVWDFFGETTIIPEEGEPYSNGVNTLLTINAVDGSVIDRDLGY